MYRVFWWDERREPGGFKPQSRYTLPESRRSNAIGGLVMLGDAVSAGKAVGHPS
jgi:hypothetical protein